MRVRLLAGALLLLAAAPLLAGGTRVTLVHTNDLHSKLLGYHPSIDYTPATTGDDTTIGGWARIATVIRRVTAERTHPVFALDGGDWSQGTLFHLITREECPELVLMGQMGIDAATLGNHEFDVRPWGLEKMIAAVSGKKTPHLVASNILFDAQDPRDDGLEAQVKSGLLKPWVLVTRGDVRLACFGLMGVDAARKAPYSKPVTFQDPVKVARAIVQQIVQDGSADLIACLSHSGLAPEGERGEDVDIARAVPEIDVIVSGHTSVPREKPEQVGTTTIVHAGAYGQQVGILELERRAGDWVMTGYQALPIDDRIPGDPALTAAVEEFQRKVEDRVLQPLGLRFHQPIAELDHPLLPGEPPSPLGRLIVEGIHFGAARILKTIEPDGEPPALAVQGHGQVRAPLLPGKTGVVDLYELFQTTPLGVGADDSAGYPLVRFHATAADIEKMLEIITSVAPSKGADYFPHVSALRFEWNPYRVLFDRVTKVWLRDLSGEYRPLDTSDANTRLYPVVTDSYNAAFIKVIGDFTFQFLKIVPRDREGRPIEDLNTCRLDGDPTRQGIQEVKEIHCLVEFLRSQPDTDGDGLPEVPRSFSQEESWVVARPSWNPADLLASPGASTRRALMVLVVVLIGGLAGILLVRRRLRRIPS